MLFKRKQKLPLWKQLREIIWPSSGWKRTFKYIKHRLLRLPATDHSIALGLSIGCAISWTPTMPFQILQCFLLCLLLRANFLAAVLATVVGNPWTFSFLFLTSYEVGKLILSGLGLGDFMTIDVHLINILKNLVLYPKEVWWPTLLGGYALAILTLPIFYHLFLYLLRIERAAVKKVGKTAHVIAEKVHDIKEHRQERKEEKKQDRK